MKKYSGIYVVFIAAIYLDQGFEIANKVVLKFVKINLTKYLVIL